MFSIIKHFFFIEKLSNLIFLNFSKFIISAELFFFQIYDKCVFPLPGSPKTINFLVSQSGHLLINLYASLFDF